MQRLFESTKSLKPRAKTLTTCNDCNETFKLLHEIVVIDIGCESKSRKILCKEKSVKIYTQQETKKKRRPRRKWKKTINQP